jgi:Na+-driven multidrug efflux pump
VRLRLGGWRLEARFFKEILRVGAVAALITVQTNATVAVTTALVGQFGAAAIAGYGVGARLEYLLVPLVFGLGSPLVAMVGTSIGAGRHARALRTAWIGAGIAFVLTETIGLAASAMPVAWLSLFDRDPTMLRAGAQYLRVVGPCYGLYGLGMALYFASQGAGRLTWPFLANLSRLVIATVGAWTALTWLGTGQTGLFAMLAAALVVFGTINAAAVALGSWSRAVR